MPSVFQGLINTVARNVKAIAGFFLLLTACVAAYSNTFHSPFAFDDQPFITNNPKIHIAELSLSSLHEAACEGKIRQRPLSQLSFAINYYFGRDNTFSYHIVNFFIHLLSGLVLFSLINHTLNLSSGGSSAATDRVFGLKAIAFFAASAWLVHPIHIESVTYICQRMTSLAALFSITSLLFFIKGRLCGRQPKNRRNTIMQWVYFGISLLAGVCAVASKQNAATLPVVILLYEWFFFRNSDAVWVKQSFAWVAGFVILSVFLGFVFLGEAPVDRILSAYTRRDFTLYQRILTEFRVVIYYISLIGLPYHGRFNLDYDYPLSDTLILPPVTILSAVAILSLLFLSLYVRKTDRFLAFGILWFLAQLVIESSVIGLEIIFEHRTYLPSMFLIPAMVVLCFKYVNPRWFVSGVLVFLIILEALWTYQRNEIWLDNIRLWKDCVQKSPLNSRAHYNLGCVLAKHNLYDEMITRFGRAAELAPGSPEVHYNLGYVLAQKQAYEDAIIHFNKAVTFDPENAEAHSNLANALSETGQSDLALKHYTMAINLKPGSAEFHANLGAELFSQGKIDDAVKHYTRSYELDQKKISILNRLGYALFRQGHIDDAIGYYSKALELSPENSEARGKMGDALLTKGQVDEAIKYYIMALKLNPDDAQSHYNLGIAYYQTGEKAKAFHHFKNAAELSSELQFPDFID